jgi:VanZ like family
VWEKKRIAGILCLLLIAGLLFSGLWPFDLCPKNRAYLLPDKEGLYFDGQHRRFKLSVGGIAYTPSPLSSIEHPFKEEGSFTIEILLRPGIEVNSGVPHILSFSANSGKEIVYLGQWKQELIVRWFKGDQSGKKRMREIGLAHALVKGNTSLLTIASNRESTSIYLNGVLGKSFQGTALIGHKESIRGCSVILGNSRDVKSPWTGSTLALKLYERALSAREIVRDHNGLTESPSRDRLIAAFAFDKIHGTLIPDLSGNQNSMKVPEHIRLSNSILGWPDWNIDRTAPIVKDAIVNVLGFMPLGFLLSFWLEQTHRSGRWRSYVFATLMGALISLGIEVAQAFIPARDSSMADVICNTMGAAMGVTSFNFYCFFKDRKRPQLPGVEA